MPADTVALVTATAPVTPLIVVGPVAVSVNEPTVEGPPLVSVTVFTSVRTGAMSLLLIVQVAVWPMVRARLDPVNVPEVQLQLPGAYPARLVSDSA